MICELNKKLEELTCDSMIYCETDCDIIGNNVSVRIRFKYKNYIVGSMTLYSLHTSFSYNISNEEELLDKIHNVTIMLLIRECLRKSIKEIAKEINYKLVDFQENTEKIEY